MKDLLIKTNFRFYHKMDLISKNGGKLKTNVLPNKLPTNILYNNGKLPF